MAVTKKRATDKKPKQPQKISDLDKATFLLRAIQFALDMWDRID